jgi:hypothetical protein
MSRADDFQHRNQGAREVLGASWISFGASDRLEPGTQAIEAAGTKRNGRQNSAMGCGSRSRASRFLSLGGERLVYERSSKP